MKSRTILSSAIAALGAAAMTGAASAADQRETISATQGAPVIVLMPLAITTAPDFSNGCWARLYDSTDYKGDRLALVGPIDMPNMRTAFGTDWSGDFDSIQTGPKATLTVYDAENYKDKAATFGPGKAVRDLDEKMGLFEQIRSVKIACTSGTKTSATSSGGSASDGNKESFASLDKDNDGMIGRVEAAADVDAKSQFDRLDSNQDQKLSRAEYEAWDKATTK